MVDETTDVTNKEQVTVVMRRIDEKFEVFEEFLGLYSVSSIDAASLFSVIRDTLVRLNLPLIKIRGQCYDGCITMSGSRSGVAKRVKDEEPRAVFTHCYSHSLNLAANDSVKKSNFMNRALETTHEITKLIKLSPKRDAIFHQMKFESDLSSDTHSPGIRLLCPTRWTVRADSLQGIMSNYKVLLSTWDKAQEVVHDTDSKVRIQGVCAQMNTFDFLFGTMLGEMVLRHSDNLSRTLQDKACSAAEGQHVASMVVRTLQSLRGDEPFNLFGIKVRTFSASLDIEPHLPCRRKAPKR